jgi:hypothetical protein
VPGTTSSLIIWIVLHPSQYLYSFLRRSSRNKRTSFTHLNDSDIEIVSPPQMVPYRRAGTAAAAVAAAVAATVFAGEASSAVEPVVPSIRKAGGVSPLVGGPAAHRKRLNRFGLRNVSHITSKLKGQCHETFDLMCFPLIILPIMAVEKICEVMISRYNASIATQGWSRFQ